MRELIQGPLLYAEDSISIKEMRQGGVWNWNAISFVLPQCIKDRILATPFQLYGNKEDSMNWRLSKDGEFTIGTTYNLVRAEEEQVSEFRGRWIWKIDTLRRICHFLWLCHHNSVPVRGVVAARGIECDVLCPLYKNEEESITHLLRDCPFARYLWGQLGVLFRYHFHSVQRYRIGCKPIACSTR